MNEEKEEGKITIRTFIIGSILTVVGFLSVVFVIWLFFPTKIDSEFWSGAIGLLVFAEIVEAFLYLRKK